MEAIFPAFYPEFTEQKYFIKPSAESTRYIQQPMRDEQQDVRRKLLFKNKTLFLNKGFLQDLNII